MQESGLGSAVDPFGVALARYKRQQEEESERLRIANDRRDKAVAGRAALPFIVSALCRSTPRFGKYLLDGKLVDNIVLREEDVASIHLSSAECGSLVKKGIFLAMYLEDGRPSDISGPDGFAFALVDVGGGKQSFHVLVRRHLRVHGLYWVLPSCLPEPVADAVDCFVELAHASLGKGHAVTDEAVEFFETMFRYRPPK